MPSSPAGFLDSLPTVPSLQGKMKLILSGSVQPEMGGAAAQAIRLFPAGDEGLVSLIAL
jgi:hypothetical protein